MSFIPFPLPASLEACTAFITLRPASSLDRLRGLCHGASAQPVTRQRRPSASEIIDTCSGWTLPPTWSIRVTKHTPTYDLLGTLTRRSASGLFIGRLSAQGRSTIFAASVFPPSRSTDADRINAHHHILTRGDRIGFIADFQAVRAGVNQCFHVASPNINPY